MADVLPVGWERKNIGELVTIKHGYAFEGVYFTKKPTKYILLTPGNFNKNGTLYFGNNTKYYEGSIPSDFVLKNKDVLIVMTDLTKEMHILGNTIVLYSEKKILHNQRIGKFEFLYPNKLFKNYLCCIMNSDAVKKHIKNTATGTTVRHTSPTKILEAYILLPPLPEQKKIASILSSIDEVIEKTTAQVAKLKDLKTSLMQELFTRGIGHSEFKDSPVGRIPVEWEVLPLGDIVIDKGLQTGPFGSQLHAHEYVEYGIPVVMPKDMKNQSINTDTIARITDKKAKKLDKHKVEEGDILFSRRGDIGRCVLVHKENIGWLCGTGCLRVRLGKKINPAFFASYLTLTNVIEWLNNNAVGQTMLNLNTSILSELPVILPPIKEQITIANTFFSIDKKITTTNQKLSALNHTKKALMQDLLTGKKRVM